MQQQQQQQQWGSDASPIHATPLDAAIAPAPAAFCIRTLHCPVVHVQPFGAAPTVAASTLSAPQAAAVVITIIQHLCNDLQLIPAPWPQLEAVQQQLLAAASSSRKRPPEGHRQVLKMVTSLQQSFESIRRVFAPPADEHISEAMARRRDQYPRVQQVLVTFGASLYRPAMIYRLHVAYTHQSPSGDSKQQTQEMDALSRNVVRQLMHQVDRLRPDKLPRGLNSANKRMHVLFQLDRRADVELCVRSSLLTPDAIAGLPVPAAAAAASSSSVLSAAATSSCASDSFFSDDDKEGTAEASADALLDTQRIVDIAQYASIKLTNIAHSGPRMQDSFSFKRPITPPPSPPPEPAAVPMEAAAASSAHPSAARSRPQPPKRVRVFKEPTPPSCLPYTLLIGNSVERAQMLLLYGDHARVEDREEPSHDDADPDDMDGEGDGESALDDEMMQQASPQPMQDGPASPSASIDEDEEDDAAPLWYLCTQPATFANGRGLF